MNNAKSIKIITRGKSKSSGLSFPIKIIIIVAFFVFMMWSMVSIHERIHESDFKDVAINGTIYVFNCPSNSGAGCYTYTYLPKDEARVKEIQGYTEWKAGIFNAVYLIIFMLVSLFILRL